MDGSPLPTIYDPESAKQLASLSDTSKSLAVIILVHTKSHFDSEFTASITGKPDCELD